MKVTDETSYDDILPLKDNDPRVEMYRRQDEWPLEAFPRITRNVVMFRKHGSSTLTHHRLWQIAWDLWEYWNDMAHQANLRQRHIDLNTLIHTELQYSIPPAASHLLSMDHPSLKISSTPYQKQAWLTNMRAHKTFARHKQNSTDPALLQMQKLASQYFAHYDT